MKLSHSHLEERTKGHAVIADGCSMIKCLSPFGYLTPEGWMMTASHSKDAHPLLVTAEDLRQMAEIVESLGRSNVTIRDEVAA
jgi:hypothetical protein